MTSKENIKKKINFQDQYIQISFNKTLFKCTKDDGSIVAKKDKFDAYENMLANSPITHNIVQAVKESSRANGREETISMQEPA
jgi:hypothetical protein